MAKMLQIDGSKLKAILEERKLKRSNVSKALGFNEAFMTHCIIRNNISVGAARMLETLYAIPFDEYKWCEPEPEPEPQPEPEQEEHEVVEQTEIEPPKAEPPQEKQPFVVPLDMEQLQKAIELALTNMRTDYDAMRAAIREGILDAFTAAVNDSDMRYQITSLLMNAHLSALQLNLKKINDRNKR